MVMAYQHCLGPDAHVSHKDNRAHSQAFLKLCYERNMQIIEHEELRGRTDKNGNRQVGQGKALKRVTTKPRSGRK